MLAAMIDGLSEVRGERGRRRRRGATTRRTPTRAGCATAQPRLGDVDRRDVLGDVGLLLSMPRQGLRQLRDRVGRRRRAAGAVRRRVGGDGDHRAQYRVGLRQHLDHGRPPTGDEYVINGEKIYVTSGERADAVVVWATLGPVAGPGGDRPSWCPRHAGHGSSGSSTSSASRRPTPRRSSSRTAGPEGRTCSAHPRSTPSRGSPVRWRPSTTPGRSSRRWRSAVPARRLDLTRAAAAGGRRDRLRPAGVLPARRRGEAAQMEADWEGAYLPMLQAAWMADNRRPNSLEASMAKAKRRAGSSDITLSCVELAGSVGYSEAELLEKRARTPRSSGHLRGHPADPAADRRPPGARAEQRRARRSGPTAQASRGASRSTSSGPSRSPTARKTVSTPRSASAP